MWYFSWILGLGFACTFAVLNAMWLEIDVGPLPENESSEGHVGD